MIIESHPADPVVHLAAIRIAQRCRHIIQTCLREEEWGDADREFYFVCREELERWQSHTRKEKANEPQSAG